MIIRVATSGVCEYRPVHAGRSPFCRRGISLIEVLLALAIFLLSLVSIGRLVDMGTDNARDANAQTVGIRLAQSKLAEVEAGIIPLTGGASGTFPEDPDWEFQVDSAQSAIPNVYNVTVRVSARTGRSVTVTMGQMVFDPLQSGTAAEAQQPQTTASGSGTTASGGTGQ